MTAEQQWEYLQGCEPGEAVYEHGEVWIKTDPGCRRDLENLWVNYTTGKLVHFSVIPWSGTDHPGQEGTLELYYTPGTPTI